MLTSGKERTIAQLLRVPYRKLVEELYARLAHEGYPDLQPAYGNIFPYLRDGPIRSIEIATRAQLTKQSVGYLVDALEAAGYVKRIPDPADHRAKLVVLTKRGESAERAATREIERIEGEWAALIAGDAVRLRRALERLNDALDPPAGVPRR